MTASACGHLLCQGAPTCKRFPDVVQDRNVPDLATVLVERLERELARRAADEADELERELLTTDYGEFFRAAWHVHEPTTPLAWSWPYQAVCDHLASTVEDWAHRQRDPSFVQRIRDLLITLPPGCLKSRLLAYLIPWAWLRWPELRAIALSCNPRVALRDSMYSRDLIASEWYQRTFAPTWKVRSDEDAKGIYSNDQAGSRSAHGLDARIVGTRSDFLVVDDPHDPEEAESDAQRTSVNERWDSSIANRVNDLGSSVRIGAAQRTHEDDWSARRIAEGWVHVDFPMLFEPDRACVTPLGTPDRRTVEGACLHPERFPPHVITAERKRVGERRWATLYQGRPAPAGGAMIKTAWIRFHRAPGKPDASSARPSGCWTGPSVETPAKFDEVCIAADLAGGKLTTSGDYNVIVAVGKKGADFYLLDCWRARADFPEVQRKFREFANRWPRARKIVEQAAAGASLVASLQREISGVIGVPPSGSKEARVSSVLAFWEAGNVHLDEHWTGLDDAITELITFPSAKHDDFIDACTLALSQLVGTPEDEDERRTFLCHLLGAYNGPAGPARRAFLVRELASSSYTLRDSDEDEYGLGPGAVDEDEMFWRYSYVSYP